jgi:conjugal transfer pilin signal peptidase TrbI
MRTLFLHRHRHDGPVPSGRLRLRTFAERSAAHLKRWALVYVGLAALALWFHAHYAFGLNASPSLPHRLFLIHKGEVPGRGDFVAFRWAGGGPYPAGVTFIKVLAGVPGDEVTRNGEGFHVNGVAVGVPKPVSRQGQALEPGPTGRIPEGRYYVQAGHPDSLDSRYRLTGWIHASQIIGRARALF